MQQTSSLKDILKGEKVIWVIYAIFCIVSLIEVFSADSRLTFKSHDLWAPFIKHAVLLTVAVLTAWMVHRIPSKYIKLIGTAGYVVSVITLILTQFIGNETNGTTRWISIFGFQFQPSEIAKLSVILIVANIISRWRDNDGKIMMSATWWAIGLSLFVIALIATENFSTAALLALTVILMLYFGQMQKKFAIRLGVSIVFGLFSVLAIIRYTPPQIFEMATMVCHPFHRTITWQNRLKNFGTPRVAPEEYDLDKDAQVAHANIAIEQSHGIGKMPGNSTERDYLSQASSDFIFAIIIEETGLLGAAGIIFLYIALIVKIGQIASRCSNPFQIFTLLGIAMIIAIQAIANMAVAVSIFPVTGQPLPFISRGGSSIIMSGVYIGIILSISRTAKHEDVEDEERIKTQEVATEPVDDDEDVNND